MKNKVIIIILFCVVLITVLITFLMSKNNTEISSKLVIGNKNVVIKIGDTYKINAYVENYPNASFIWKSTNDEVATVSNGLVKALDYGNADIVVTAIYGDNQTLADYCTLKIVSGNVDTEVTSISLPDGDLLLGLNRPYDINGIFNIIPKDGLIESKKYRSIDENILDINKDGVIKCLNVGKSIVDVEVNNIINNSINVYCVDKSITGTVIVNPTSIKLNDDKIKIGETKRLSYAIEPLNTNLEYLSFSSQDNSIVSIDNNGNIKGLKTGTTIISVKSINGIVEECNVTVEKDIIQVISINVEKEKLELNVGDKYVLSPTITPYNAENGYLTFTSNNNNIAMLSMNEAQNSVTINAVGKGNAVITIESSNGISKQIIVTVNQKQNTSSSVNSPISFSEYPLTSATIVSTGSVNNSLLSSASDSNFDLCKKESPQLTLKINGTTVGQDGNVTVRSGHSFKVEVYLPTKCGKILTLTRTSPDGSSSWGEYFLQNDNPFVDRDNSNTYLSGVTKYTWTIAAKKPGTCTLSQTAQFDVQSPNGRKANIKSMIRLKVKAI